MFEAVGSGSSSTISVEIRWSSSTRIRSTVSRSWPDDVPLGWRDRESVALSASGIDGDQ
jgi:hypothetical protein